MDSVAVVGRVASLAKALRPSRQEPKLATNVAEACFDPFAPCEPNVGLQETATRLGRSVNDLVRVARAVVRIPSVLIGPFDLKPCA